MSVEKFGRYKAEVEDITGRRERLVDKVKPEKHLDIYGRLSDGMRIKKYLHGPMDFAKTLKLGFSCRGSTPARQQGDAYQYEPLAGKRRK